MNYDNKTEIKMGISTDGGHNANTTAKIIPSRHTTLKQGRLSVLTLNQRCMDVVSTLCTSVDLTSWRWIKVESTLWQRCVCLLGSYQILFFFFFFSFFFFSFFFHFLLCLTLFPVSLLQRNPKRPRHPLRLLRPLFLITYLSSLIRCTIHPLFLPDRMRILALEWINHLWSKTSIARAKHRL